MLRSMRVRRSIADALRPVNLTAAALCLFSVGRAAAHPEFAPATVNRYVKFDLVAPGELRLAYTVMVGAAPAATWRRAVDANADGRLDDAETRALGERVRAAATAGLSLAVDGKPVTPVFDAPLVGLAGAEVAPSPFSVDLVARISLAGVAPHTVRFDDNTPEPQLGDTEIRIEESPATRLIASHRGATGDDKQAHFLFRGQKFSALEDRSITFSFAAGAHAPQAASASPPTAMRWWWIGVLPAVAALWLGLKRRRAGN